MFAKVIPAACLAAVFGAAPALADLKGPAELPPAGYSGQQYVDSRGCVFLRAGYGGQVTWVPRVTRDRKQLCGYPASGGAVESVDASSAPKAEPPPAPAPVAVAEPAPKPAPKVEVAAAAPKVAPKAEVKVAAAPVVIDRPATPTERAATAPEVGGTVVTAGGGDGYRLACPADTPVAQRFEIRGGGSKVMCTRGDGSLDGANFPVLVAGSTAGHPTGYDAWVAAGHDPAAPAAAPGGTVYASAGEGSPVHAGSKSAKLPSMVPPPGYKLAWKDDRLNPNRGKQTVDGFFQQDEIWTRTAPAELREDKLVRERPVKVVIRKSDGSVMYASGAYVTDQYGNTRLVVDRSTERPAAGCGPDLGTTCPPPPSGGGGEETSASSKSAVVKTKKAAAPEAEAKVVAKAPAKSAKAAPAEAGDLRLLVQVGTFGVKSNADGAAGRLQALGLPVAKGKLKGGALTVVYAGPFASASDAKAALSAARRAGFSDAVIVQ